MKRNESGQFDSRGHFDVDLENAVNRDCIVCGKETSVVPAFDEETGEYEKIPQDVMCDDCLATHAFMSEMKKTGVI